MAAVADRGHRDPRALRGRRWREPGAPSPGRSRRAPSPEPVAARLRTRPPGPPPGTARRTAGLIELLEHGVGERDERERRQQSQERASGAEGERVAREDRGPDRHDAGEEQRLQRRRRRDLDARLLADQRARRRARAAACRGSAVRARSSRGRRPARSTTSERDRAQSVASKRFRRSSAHAITPRRARRPSAPTSPWPDEHAAERERRRHRHERDGRRARSDAVYEPTFPGGVPSVLQSHRTGEGRCSPSRRGSGRDGPAWPAPPAGPAARAAGCRGRRDRRRRRAWARTRRRCGSATVSSRGSGGAPTRRATCRRTRVARRWASAGPMRPHRGVGDAGQDVEEPVLRSRAPAGHPPSRAAARTRRERTGPRAWPPPTPHARTPGPATGRAPPSRVSRNTTPLARRDDSSWRIIS